jgi:hypothetical protein
VTSGRLLNTARQVVTGRQVVRLGEKDRRRVAVRRGTSLFEPRARADRCCLRNPIIHTICYGVGHSVGNWTAIHFARAALRGKGFSWAIQWPENTVASVRFAQLARIGVARLESSV